VNHVLPIVLPAASSQAHEWNFLFLALLLLSSAVVLAVFLLVLVFAIRIDCQQRGWDGGCRLECSADDNRLSVTNSALCATCPVR